MTELMTIAATSFVGGMVSGACLAVLARSKLLRKEPHVERISFLCDSWYRGMTSFFVSYGYTVDRTFDNETGLYRVSIHRILK